MPDIAAPVAIGTGDVGILIFSVGGADIHVSGVVSFRPHADISRAVGVIDTEIRIVVPVRSTLPRAF